MLFFSSKILEECEKIKVEINRTSPPASQGTVSNNAHVTELIIRRTAEVGNESHNFSMDN